MQHKPEIPYRKLFDKLDQGFAILERVDQPDGQFDYKCVDANPLFATLAGAIASDVVGMTFRQACPHESPEKLLIYEKVYQTGEPILFEQVLTSGRIVEAYAFRIEDGPPYRIAILGKDITQRKTAEHALRDEDQFLHDILDSTPEYIVVLDLQGRMQYWNKTAKLAAPTQTAQYIGQNWITLWKDPDERAAAEQAQSSALAGRPSVFEGHLTNGDQTKWWEVLLSSIPEASGRPVRLLALAREITDRKIVEEYRDRVMQELERSNTDLSQFSYIVAHDLQAPVRTVGTLLGLLEERRKADQEVNRMMVSAADRMGHLIGSLLDYARAGHSQLRTETVPVNDVVETVRDMLGSLINETGAEISYGSLPTLEADRVQMEQLFQNLVSNAIKYRRDGISPVIRITAEPVESGWQFSVEDNGRGIPPENQKTIFEPLKRFAEKEVPGCGIGLSVCRTIVDRHGGSIWVESEPNKGATFKFKLPASVPRNVSETKREAA
jgi:PAS domain S-box-containing protein